eukprot:gene32133-38867_t
MEALSVSLDVKPFGSLLQALRKKTFPVSDDAVFSEDEIVQSIYRKFIPDIDIEEARNEVTTFESIIKKAAQDYWSPDNLNDFLEQRSFPTEHTTLFTEFWRRESDKIHSKILQQSTFNNILNDLSWRVDMKALTKNSAENNEALAYFELNMLERKDAGVDKRIVKFEMGREDVAKMVEQLSAIQDTFERIVAK